MSSKPSANSGFSLYSILKEILFRKGEKKDKSLSKERAKRLYDEISRKISLTAREMEMLHGVLFFRDTVVKEIMVPRTDMVSIEENTPLDKIVEKIIEKGFSRIPVYKNRIDNIVGLVYAKDLFKFWWDRKPVRAADIMREPMFVPETKKIEDLLRDFKEKKVHMAFVVDEHGNVSGLVTLEDVLEEIVGEIEDEYDKEEKNLVEKVGDGVFLVDPRIDLDEFNEIFGTNLYEEGCETLGGLVMSRLGRIPEEGEELKLENIKIKVEKSTPKRIEKLKVLKEDQG